ncbi:eukaryotic type KH-domain (KH-domain type I) [Daedalea quercina L-15889]|uniref:Pre-rRNA-processing protein PNO1 n=1 Tax=Daedalea quercina L-15889 TaxID=1314783 RepID=A0A165RXD2_9APHY|nr:eukaryotic type KH-domain (KH-domain type I) [Daedalea quercina L-15889]
MVVLHAESSSSSTAHKKNRRKLNKKASVKPADAPVQNDTDDEMGDGPVDITEVDPQHSIREAEQRAGDDDELMIDTDPSPLLAQSSAPAFPPLPASAQRSTLKSEIRRIPIPPHRMTPLKKDWVNIFSPLTEMLQLQVRMNVQRKCVEIRTSKHTQDIGAIQKGADFVKSYALGFDVNDAIALLRLDDLYLDSFEIKDVKTLHGDHLSRAIGRIAGQDGKTKFTIENASRTRIVLADTKIHILGSFQNIKIARDAIVSLILGSPPGKVYAGLRTVSSRMRQRAL